MYNSAYVSNAIQSYPITHGVLNELRKPNVWRQGREAGKYEAPRDRRVQSHMEAISSNL